jgi:cysteinyl-tRNA synthetase
MTINIHNTMKRKKEPFIPQKEGKVTMYACGVTVYDLSHIGHARAMVVFDVIHRYLRASGYDVTFVRNYTDIDDKIINRANEESVPFNVISERYIKEFDVDMESLGIMVPEHTPRATEHISGMIEMIETLIEKGHAYVVEGDVYFDVSSFKEYGKLSGKDTDSLLSGARVDVDERKKSPVDFALWKNSKEGEPSWDCPWGKGRPGWHIECSVMSKKYLGDTFDIHGGGMDLIFPHHENEIAQAECASGKEFARYWIHNGFVNIDKEKMSKSLKNFLTIRDVLKDYHYEVIRLFLLSSHYRSPVDFSHQNLIETKIGLDRFYSVLADLENHDLFAEINDGLDDEKLMKELDSLSDKFKEAMDDDFNTAAAIGHLYSLTRSLNTVIDAAKKNKGKMSPLVAEKAKKVFSEVGKVFGLFQTEPNKYFDAMKKEGLASSGDSEDEIESLISERTSAKKEKNFARADEIRDILTEKGIILKDTPQGTEWSFKNN